MLYKSVPYYRPASKTGTDKEDTICINDGAGMFAVCDGVSGPYSPNNPKTMYGRLTGGQMVGATINHILENASANQDFQSILGLANRIVGLRHFWENRQYQKEAVAGACVAACQIRKDSALLLLAGDCFAFWRNNQGVHCLTNFDQAAYDFEKRGDEAFQECLNAVDTEFPETKGKNIGKAWDKYFPYFGEKQFFRANRNLGKGGHAMLNGDPGFLYCHTTREIPLQDLRWVFLCTDGLLPPHLTCPFQHAVLAEGIAHFYETAGRGDIGGWRDAIVAEHERKTRGSDMPHIEGWPEGSIIVVKFSA